MTFPLSVKELYLYCTMNEREMNIGKIANSLKMSKLTNKNKKVMKIMETTIKKQVSAKGKNIELTTINHNVFGDCYYIYVEGNLEYFQYGTRKLDAIFNEFITEEQ